MQQTAVSAGLVRDNQQCQWTGLACSFRHWVPSAPVLCVFAGGASGEGDVEESEDDAASHDMDADEVEQRSEEGERGSDDGQLDQQQQQQQDQEAEQEAEQQELTGEMGVLAADTEATAVQLVQQPHMGVPSDPRAPRVYVLLATKMAW